MKKVLFFAIASLLTVVAAGQVSVDAGTTVGVVFYNVENLFDTTDDKAPGDEEFTPESAKGWTIERYNKKIQDIAEVLSSVNKKELPGLIGLAEVENRNVLEDLIKSKPLRRGDYKIVHRDSPDERGIDVALLYRPEEFKPVAEKYIQIKFNFDTADRTREILYVKGNLENGDLVHVFVNHWPSRGGEANISEMKRITAAVELRKEMDHIINFEPEARIIVMGDFNDEPTNRSVLQILNATNKKKNLSNRDLYNLMYDAHNEQNSGTITYRENWQMFDQIMVTRSLFAGTGYKLSFSSGAILNSKLTVATDEKTGMITPFRTWYGNTYNGGVSDHLPVYIILTKEEK